MSRVEAMRKYIELIHDLVENDQFHTDQVTEDLEEIVVELNSLYADYAGRIKVLNRQTNEDFRDEQYRQATEGLFIRRREESSLFQPGAEVFYDGQNQHSILEAVQDLVQHDIVESVHDAKGFHPIQEDPLNVMEPRPIKASSEESLLRTGRSYNEVYELLMETNRRLDLLEQRLNAFLERWSLGALRLYLKGRPILARALQVSMCAPGQRLFLGRWRPFGHYDGTTHGLSGPQITHCMW